MLRPPVPAVRPDFHTPTHPEPHPRVRALAMLVLSRKKNESIVINNDVVITVVEIRGDKVRLGIVAPKEVPVHREEVYEAIHGVSPAKPMIAAQPA